MTQDEVSKAIRDLKPGVIARLFGVPNPALVGLEEERWIEWVERQPATSSWKSWIDCFCDMTIPKEV